MSFKKLMALACTTLIISSTSVLAKVGTETGGGGGDASEGRVHEIRSDILKWINNEGAKGLIFPSDISYNEYSSKMIDILKPQKVIIGFTDEKVIFHNSEKTCKSFIDNYSAEMHILCNISRFGQTSDSEQYKLIHHEYAGLVSLEKNDGAASDYKLSSQLTEYLSYEKVLKLAIKKSGSHYKFEGLTPLNEACIISFDINDNDSLVNLVVSGTALKYDRADYETLTITNNKSVYRFHDANINANYLAESAFQVGKYKYGIIAKAKKSSGNPKHQIELKGISISELESIYAKTNYGLFGVKIGYICERLKSVN